MPRLWVAGLFPPGPGLVVLAISVVVAILGSLQNVCSYTINTPRAGFWYTRARHERSSENIRQHLHPAVGGRVSVAANRASSRAPHGAPRPGLARASASIEGEQRGAQRRDAHLVGAVPCAQRRGLGAALPCAVV